MEEKSFFDGKWKAVEKLGEGSFGTVYKAEKKQYGITIYSAIKQIIIPQSNKEYSILKSEGMTKSDIEKSFDNQVKKWVEEIEFLNQFKDNESIVSIEDFEVLERKDTPGRIINIRMELLQNIDDNILGKVATDKKVLKMALDILNALEDCEEKNIVHRDIKPDNVLTNGKGIYKLGDFGEAKSIEKTVSNMSKKGTENYMAPEIFKGERGSKTVDTYSLGIMLYKYFNNNRIPFLPNYPDQITFEDRENALYKRMSGEKMPSPAKATEGIAKIILKACSYKAEDRYKSAMDFRNDVEKEYNAIQVPTRLFDFQEGEIEKEESLSQYDKTSGIFDDDEKEEDKYDKTSGIFDNELNENNQFNKLMVVDFKKDFENLKNNFTVSGDGLESEKKQFGITTKEKNEEKIKQTANDENENHMVKKENNIELLEIPKNFERHEIVYAEYSVPSDYYDCLYKPIYTLYGATGIYCYYMYTNYAIQLKTSTYRSKKSYLNDLIKEYSISNVDEMQIYTLKTNSLDWDFIQIENPNGVTTLVCFNFQVSMEIKIEMDSQRFNDDKYVENTMNIVTSILEKVYRKPFNTTLSINKYRKEQEFHSKKKMTI